MSQPLRALVLVRVGTSRLRRRRKIIGLDGAGHPDHQRLAAAVERLACRRPDPAFAHAIFLDVASLDAAKAHPDAALERRLVMERAGRVDAEPVGRNVGHFRTGGGRTRRGGQPASALTRFIRREILREAAFLCTMPFCAARASLGSAALNASAAPFGSLAAIASSTLRTYVRISLRRD